MTTINKPTLGAMKIELTRWCVERSTSIWLTSWVLVGAACASSPPPSSEHVQASSSAIRAAEEGGASQSPNAALYLQMAKEHEAKGKRVESDGDHERAALWFMQAEADGELAVAMAHSEAEKSEAQQAVNNLKTLHQQNR